VASDPTTPLDDQGTVGDYWIDLAKNESPWRIWDKLILGGVVFPGLAQISPEISNETTPDKWLKTKATGTTPAEFLITLSDKGYNPGRIRAVLQIWTLEQWEDLRETLPKFAPRTSTKPKNKTRSTSQLNGSSPDVNISDGAGRDAFDIIHPATALLGIDSVIILRIGLPPVFDQTLFVEIDMMQYFPNTGDRILHSDGGSDSAGGLAPPPAAGKNVKT
jgi:hypothetical protein